MKKQIIALGLLLITAALPGAAGADSWCWDACRWNGSWEMGAEALYWKNCSCDWEYGLLRDSEGQTTAVGLLNPDYDWGFRVLGGYYSCDSCNFLTLDWVYWRSTNTITRTAPAGQTIVDANLSITTGKFKIRSHYNRVNLRGGIYLYRGCDINFYTYAGVRWVDIEEKRQIDGFATQQTGQPVLAASRTKADFWGVGLEVGVGASYYLGCNFYLNGNIGGSTALGERRFLSRLTDQATIHNSETINYPTRTIVVPGVDLRLGVSYKYDCSCFSITGEIGYEHTTYFNAMIFRQAGNVGSITPLPEFVCSNWGVGGPFASLRVRF